MSPTVKKFKKKYNEYKQKVFPWHLKDIFMFACVMVVPLLIILLIVNIEKNVLEYPNLFIFIYFTFLLIVIGFFIYRRKKYIFNSQDIQKFVKEEVEKFSEEGKNYFIEELSKSGQYQTAITVIFSISSFCLSIYTLLVTLSLRAVQSVSLDDVEKLFTIPTILFAFDFYFVLFIFGCWIQSLSYKEINNIIKEIKYSAQK